MSQRPWTPRKVAIVGAGAVGSTFAYALAKSGLVQGQVVGWLGG